VCVCVGKGGGDHLPLAGGKFIGRVVARILYVALL
jgi:hypothetical protein